MQIWKKAEIDKNKTEELKLKTGLSESFVRLLSARGIDSEESLNELLNPAPLCNPFDIIDMDKAVDRIELAFQRNERICIYGDYDADGVTATALLLNYFSLRGADTFFYIPDRESEGYGINEIAVRKIAENGTKLILTVDNGISSVKEAELILSLGMELVVTDHHRPGDEIPFCCAVVDPHRTECKTSFHDWCGVGIAFKLICALEDENLKLQKVLTDLPGSIRRGFNSNNGDLGLLFDSDKVSRLLEEYSDIVAVGTIGDVVSLTDENRTIVKSGLKKINESERINFGLSALMKSASVKPPLTSHSVAFSVVPKLNAVGRLANASAAVKLLTSNDEVTASETARAIIGFNDSRQSFGEKIENDIQNYIIKNPACLNERVLIFVGENWHGGLIGIASARFCEQYGKPCLVITVDGENAKGSGRSIEGFSLFECIFNCSSLLTHFGGHPMAAGFSLKKDRIDEFRKAVLDYAKTVEMPFQKIGIDCELESEMLSIDFLNDVSKLEPFGQDNPQPVFSLSNVTLSGFKFVGKEKNHVRMSFRELPISVMKFRTEEKDFPFEIGDVLSLAVTLSKNEYNGTVSVSVIAKDIRFAHLNDEKFLRSMRGYEKYALKEELDRRQIEFLTPDREFIARVYKFIRSRGGWKHDIETLCARLNDDGGHVCRLLLALDVLFELNLLIRKGNYIVLPENPKKVNLEDSEILKSLFDSR